MSQLGLYPRGKIIIQAFLSRMEPLLISTGQEWYVESSNYMYSILRKVTLSPQTTDQFQKSIKTAFISPQWWQPGQTESIKLSGKQSKKDKNSQFNIWNIFNLTQLISFAGKTFQTLSKESAKHQSIYKILIVTSQDNLMGPQSMRFSSTNSTKYSSLQINTILCQAWAIIVICSDMFEISHNLKWKLTCKKLLAIRFRTWLDFLKLITKKVGFGKNIILMWSYIALSVDQKF